MAEAAKNKFSWNPFVRISDDAHALALARDLGLVCTALIAISYVLMIVLVMFSGQSPYAVGSDAATTRISQAAALALAAFLAWRIWARQPLWALWVVLVWMVIETLGKVLLATGGGGSVPGASFFINVVGLIAGIQAVRGGMWISKKRSAARRSAVKAGFDI
jgi:hypothetical protein